MANLYNVDLGINNLSLDQLNQIALAGGVVGGIALGFACRGQLPEARHGYGFRWVATGGCGNQGTLVLVPKSRSAWEYLQEGRRRRVMRITGFDATMAAAVADVRGGYAHEEAVLRLVAQEWSNRAFDYLDYCPQGRREVESYGISTAGVSMPRFHAVFEIVKHLRRKFA